MLNRLLAAICICALPGLATAMEAHGGHAQHGTAEAPYAGQQARAVSSFSESDLADLRAGEGWGLAKPAELRGYPGPRHVLDLADRLDLSVGQQVGIEEIYGRMNASARSLGEALIAAERALDELFETEEATPELLQARLAEAARIRAELRYVHLAAHLEVTPLLTPHQRHAYSSLRGYDGAR